MQDTTTFDSFLGQAWNDHATQAEAVAARLDAQALSLLGSAADAAALATLAQHLWGEHLGDWAGGRAFLQRLAALPVCTGTGLGAQRRCDATLALCAGDDGALLHATASDRVRIAAMAACNLAERDTARASALLQQALDEADSAQLPTTDPLHRALAVAGNNLACTLEEKTERSAAERALMLLAAQTARRHWALAGTWLEIERADYRLAMSWLQAGDPAQARLHALACLDTSRAHDGAPLEQFFGQEALALAERAGGNAAAAQASVEAARVAFGALNADDRSWCQATMDKLDKLAA